MIVTSLENQKKHKDRVNVYLDGEYFCSLSLFCVLKNRLKVGSEVTESEMEYIKEKGEIEVATDKAMKHLSKSQKTEKEIFSHLLSKGFDENIATYVVEKLKEYSYIDDEKYANDYVKSYSKYDGKRKIVYGLKQKGVPDEIINKVIDEFEFDEDIAFNVLTKYMKGKPLDIKTKQKAYRFLQGKGFDGEEISHAINSIWQGDIEDC